MSSYFMQYQSAHQTNEESIHNFVVRRKEFEKIISELSNSKNGSSFQHYIFVGRRGSGKSTLLRRTQAEIETQTQLTKKYIPVRLSEEQSGVYKIYDLWDKVIKDLISQNYAISSIDFREYKKDLKEYTRKLHECIIEFLRKEKKTLVLLIDNIDRIFRNIGEDKDLLRELLMNYQDIRIIGGSTYMSEEFWQYDKAFYQFFTIKKLLPLTLNEVDELLKHWSEVKGIPEIRELIHKHSGKIQSVRMLTDGTPRTMLIFVDMLLQREQQNGYDYLQVLVDKATPIYQERLGTLSPAQQKVITELSFFWEAVSVDDLISPCNMEGKLVSALLAQLHQLGYIEKLKANTKNLLYRVEERFFNLWLIMTQGGPQQKLEAKYLSDFLESWYDQFELKALCSEFLGQLGHEKLKSDYVKSMASALLNIKKLELPDKKKIYQKLKEKQFISITSPEIPKSFWKDLDDAIGVAINTKDYKTAISLLEALDIDEGRKNYGYAICHYEMGDFTKSEEYYLKAIDNGYVVAINNLGSLYDDQKKFELAEKYYLMAIENGYVDAINNLGILYLNQEKFELAEKYYLLAIGNGNVNAIHNLGAFYYNTNNKVKLLDLLIQHEDKLLESYSFNLSIFYLFVNRLAEFNTVYNHLTSTDNFNPPDYFLFRLMVHKQYALVYEIFENYPEVMEEHRPLYYVTLKFLKDREKEQLKTPPELEESIRDIYQSLMKEQEFYHGVNNKKLKNKTR